MMGDVTMVEFLLARLDETEAAAREEIAAFGEPGERDFPDVAPSFGSDAAGCVLVNPAHVLAWCAALRAVVERAQWLERGDPEARWEMEQVVRHLAAIWASHPAYDESWKP